jgi:hypothetical protein
MNAVHHRVFLVALMLSAVACAQIVQGSFEAGVAGGSTMPAPWTSLGNVVVFPYNGCTSEAGVGFPSDGTKWARIEAGGGAATTGSYAFTNNVAQTFTCGAAGTPLHLDVSFATAEGAGNTTFNDFMAVSVSSGTTTTTLLTLETATAAFPQNTCLTAYPSTVKNTISVDLATIFPGITPTTPVTLRVHCANGGDNAVPSYAYVDNAYIGVPPPPPIDINFVAVGGLWTLTVASPGHPNAENYNLFSLTLSNPQGTGPIFGINFDSTVLGEILSPLGTHPFHVLLDGNGNYSLGPIGIPAGLQADAVAVAISAGAVVDVSLPKRFTF